MRLVTVGAGGFLAFSHGVWLGWTPWAVRRIVPDGQRRWLISAIAGIGILFGLSLLLPLMLQPERLSIQVLRHAISYQMPMVYDQWWPRDVSRLIYGAVVTLPLVLSARIGLIGFAALLALSAIASRLVINEAFVSVWCFWAAGLSLYLLGWLRQARLT